MEIYEQECLSEHVHKSLGKLVFARADHEKTRQLFSYKEEPVVSPFLEIEAWIKQKQLELKAYTNAVEGVENLLAERVRTIEKKINAETKLAKLKEKPGKDRESNTVETELFGLYKEVENLTAIINITISYMTDIFLPLFKRRQMLLFYRILERLLNSQSTQMGKLAQAWSELLTDKNLKHF